MKFVADTNKIVACLLKDGKVRRLFFSPFLDLYTHLYAIEEIRSYKNEFLKKVSNQAFDFILNKAASKLNFVNFLPEDEECLKTAKSVAKDFNDYPFIALAIKLGIPVWTNDKQMIIYGLKTKKYIALDTQAVEELVRGESLEKVMEELKKRYLTSHNK